MLDFGNMVLASANPLEHVVAKPLFTFSLWGAKIVISNHIFMLLLATVLLILVLPLAVRDKRLVRRGFGNLIETVCVFIREEVARPFLHDRTDKYIGFIWTTFFFVLTLNLLGMVPLARIIYLLTGRESHLEGAATANIWITGALALSAFFMIHISGMREHGFGGYIRNFAPKVPWPMVPFIYLMEIIAALVKPFSLAIRLFANIFAGHVVVATIIGLALIFRNITAGFASVFAAVLLSLLELFVAFLQAYIFTFLSTIFIGFAVQPEH